MALRTPEGGRLAEIADQHVRKKLCVALDRHASGIVGQEWLSTKRDPEGRLQLAFLRHWCQDPSCAFVQVKESARQETAQTSNLGFGYLTRAQVYKLHNNDEDEAEKVLGGASHRIPHPNNPGVTLYKVFTGLSLAKREHQVQERSVSGWGELQPQNHDALEFLQGGLGQGGPAATLIPNPGDVVAAALPKAGAKGKAKASASRTPAPVAPEAAEATRLLREAKKIAQLARQMLGVLPQSPLRGCPESLLRPVAERVLADCQAASAELTPALDAYMLHPDPEGLRQLTDRLAGSLGVADRDARFTKRRMGELELALPAAKKAKAGSVAG